MPNSPLLQEADWSQQICEMLGEPVQEPKPVLNKSNGRPVAREDLKSLRLVTRASKASAERLLFSILVTSCSMSSAQPFGPFRSIATGTYSDLVRTVEIRDTAPTMIPAACETSGSQVNDLTSLTPWKSLHLFPNLRHISIDFSPSRGLFTQEDFICSLSIRLSNLNLHFLASLTLDFPTAAMFNYFVYNKAARGTNCGREVSEPVAALIGRLSVLQLYLPASERAPKPDWYGDVRNISDDGLCELVCLAKNARAVRVAFKCCKDGLEPPKSCLACTMVRSIAWPDDLDLPANGKLEHLDLGQTKGAERAVEKMVEANLQRIRSITGLKGSTEQNLPWRPGVLNLLTIGVLIFGYILFLDNLGRRFSPLVLREHLDDNHIPINCAVDIISSKNEEGLRECGHLDRTLKVIVRGDIIDPLMKHTALDSGHHL